MATRKETADYLADQMTGAGAVSIRKMFGEYGVHRDGKFVALICDDRLFVKPSEASRALLPDAEMAPPYPGAKPHPVVPEEMWEDRDALSALIAKTAEALPVSRRAKAKAHG